MIPVRSASGVVIESVAFQNRVGLSEWSDALGLGEFLPRDRRQWTLASSSCNHDLAVSLIQTPERLGQVSESRWQTREVDGVGVRHSPDAITPSRALPSAHLGQHGVA